MLLAKTDKARTAILQRDPGLSAQERHILIVSNGQRTLNDIVSLLGPATLAPIDRLLREGYLSAEAEVRGTGTVASPTGHGSNALLRASRDLASRVQEKAQAVIEAAKGAAEPAPGPAAPVNHGVAAAPTAPVTPVGPRRSLAAAKMYMLDMLQLQRSADAAALKVAIQTSSSGEDLLTSLVQGLRYLRAVSADSYYSRVATRLDEVLPEEFVPRLATALRVDGAHSTAA